MSLMRYFEDQYDDAEWEVKLAAVREGQVPADRLPSVIVRLGKPLVKTRIERAKDAIFPLLRHPDSLVRHEAIWFLSWGGVSTGVPFLLEALSSDDDESNRAYAARTLGRLADKNNVPIRNLLVSIAKNTSETDEVRKSAYGATLRLLGTAYRRNPEAFDPVGDATIADFDWGLLASLEAHATRRED